LSHAAIQDEGKPVKTRLRLFMDCRGLRERLSDAVFSGDLQRIVADSVMLSRENG